MDDGDMTTSLLSPAPAPAPVVYATPVEPDTREDELLVTKLALKECEENLVQKTQQLAAGEATRRRLLERALSAEGRLGRDGGSAAGGGSSVRVRRVAPSKPLASSKPLLEIKTSPTTLPSARYVVGRGIYKDKKLQDIIYSHLVMYLGQDLQGEIWEGHTKIEEWLTDHWIPRVCGGRDDAVEFARRYIGHFKSSKGEVCRGGWCGKKSRKSRRKSSRKNRRKSIRKSRRKNKKSRKSRKRR